MLVKPINYTGANLGDLAYSYVFKKLFPQVTFSSQAEIGALCGGNIGLESYTSQIKDCKSKYAFSISITPKSDFRELASYNKIIVRDFKSQQLLAEKGIESIYAPDFTVILESNKERGAKLVKDLFKNAQADLYKQIVVCTVNSHLMYSDSYGRPFRDELKFQNFCINLAELADNFPASFIFLPFSIDSHFDDRISCGWSYHFAKFQKKNIVVYDKLSFHDALDIISFADYTINTRLHSNIFSFIGNIPLIDATHCEKTIGFLETINLLDSSIPYNSFDWRQCKEKLDFYDKNRYDICVKLNRELIGQRQILKSVIRGCFT